MSDGLHSTGECGWNDLLGSHGIFPKELNEIRCKSIDKKAILSELNDLLHQDGVLEVLFTNFLIEFELQVENVESGRQIFANNLLQIAEHNIDTRNGRNTWFQAVNRFSYLSDDEFKAEYMELPKEIKRRKLCVRLRYCVLCSCINKRRDRH